MDDQLQLLLGTPAREESGQTASDRFRYQHHWTIHQLVELSSESSAEWVVLCEDHEDVVVVRERVDGPSITLVQVKTKTRLSTTAWTASMLCYRPKKRGAKSKKASVLGELVTASRNLGWDNIEKALLVSNIPYRLRVGGATKLESVESTYLVKVSGGCWKKLEKELGSELSSPVSKGERESIHLKQSDLSLVAYEEVTRGRLSTYIEECFGPGCGNAGPVLKVLLSEVYRRSTAKKPTGSVDEYRVSKGITRSQFEVWCEHAASTPPEEILGSWWPVAASDLSRAGVGPRRQKRLRLAALEAMVGIASGTEFDLLFERVESAVELSPDDDLLAILAWVVSTVDDCVDLSEDLVNGMALWSLYGPKQAIQAADSQPTGE